LHSAQVVRRASQPVGRVRWATPFVRIVSRRRRRTRHERPQPTGVRGRRLAPRQLAPSATRRRVLLRAGPSEYAAPSAVSASQRITPSREAEEQKNAAAGQFFVGSSCFDPLCLHASPCPCGPCQANGTRNSLISPAHELINTPPRNDAENTQCKHAIGYSEDLPPAIRRTLDYLTCA